MTIDFKIILVTYVLLFYIENFQSLSFNFNPDTVNCNTSVTDSKNEIRSLKGELDKANIHYDFQDNETPRKTRNKTPLLTVNHKLYL